MTCRLQKTAEDQFQDKCKVRKREKILGRSVGGIAYAHRTPLAFNANTTLPQASAFTALARGFEDFHTVCDGLASHHIRCGRVANVTHVGSSRARNAGRG